MKSFFFKVNIWECRRYGKAMNSISLRPYVSLSDSVTCNDNDIWAAFWTDSIKVELIADRCWVHSKNMTELFIFSYAHIETFSLNKCGIWKEKFTLSNQGIYFSDFLSSWKYSEIKSIFEAVLKIIYFQ